MSDDKTYYITTPIYYVNGDPHLGHAYTTIACDVAARFKRLDGYDVRFLTGTDEHGIKVLQAARDAGVDPQKFTDKVAQGFKDILPTLNITNDDFIRTTENRHKAGAQALWKKLLASGDIYKDSYSGWYAVRDEAYYTEEETELRTDGKRYALSSGAETTWMEEESYFFKLSAWQDRLLAFYAANPDFIQPDARKNEVISFVKSGLRDLSISRTTFDWGVDVPDDEKHVMPEGGARHVMYVWIDALTNYISALGYPDTDGMYAKYWPANVHVVGKEIIRFHCVYWPAFLMSADLAPPKQVYAHGWWTVEGEKMSKSVGNVIAPDELVKRYGVDGARYAVLRDVPFGNDGNFCHENIVNRINSDLANGLGNLAQRSLSMVAKNCDGMVPSNANLNDDDQKLLNVVYNDMLNDARKDIDEMRFDKYLERLWFGAVDAGNAYVDAQAPWKLKKENPERMATVLYTLAETVRCIAIAAQPVIPDSAGRLLDQLAVPANERTFAHIGPAHALKSGTALPAPEGVFPRLETDKEAA